jgi:hypothetical protein
MVSRRPTLSPLLCSFAAVTLLVWIGAQALCQAHCLFGACHGEAGESSCHETAASETHHADEHTPEPGHQDRSANASCETLKSALSGNAASPLVTPEFSLLYTLAPTAIAVDATAIEPATSFSRQAGRRDWVFTPEVYLGPAFRSHAPPVLS